MDDFLEWKGIAVTGTSVLLPLQGPLAFSSVWYNVGGYPVCGRFKSYKVVFDQVNYLIDKQLIALR